MLPSLRIMIILPIIAIATACAQQQPASESVTLQAGLVSCVDPRPQICTAIYDPVCGLNTDDSYKTYASACSACGDVAVIGHRPGACE